MRRVPSEIVYTARAFELHTTRRGRHDDSNSNHSDVIDTNLENIKEEKVEEKSELCCHIRKLI